MYVYFDSDICFEGALMGAQRFTTSEHAMIEVYGKRSRVFSKMRNLSNTGALFELSDPTYTPLKGDLLKISIHLDSLNRTRNMNAEVVWSKDDQMGVHFISEDAIIERMIAK